MAFRPSKIPIATFKCLSLYPKNATALAEPGPFEAAELAGCCLVAGDSFGSLLFGFGGAVAVGMPVAITIGRSNCDRLAGTGEIGRHGLGDVADGANLYDRRLRLLQHELFVDRAHLSLLFVSLLAASALFFCCG